MSVLLAYIMLIGPIGFDTLARGDTLCAQVETAHWATAGHTIEYGHWDGQDFVGGYDANGSVIEKITKDQPDTIETVTYEYNLRNRLVKVTKETWDDLEGGSALDKIVEISEYMYNDAGIRVEARYTRLLTIDNTGDPVIDDWADTEYLIDSHNHTGYAQVLEESVYDGGSDVATTSYTLGDDVVSHVESRDVFSQERTYEPVRYLLYDGHGSTRQVLGPAQVNCGR